MQRSTPFLSNPDLRSLSGADLLQRIAHREDEATARAAFNEFHRRYEGYLFAVASRVCRQFPGTANELFDAVVQNTFLKAYQRAGTFDAGKVKAAQLEAGVKAWLGRIADNEHKALLRELQSQMPLSLVEDVAIYEGDYAYDPSQEPNEAPVSVYRALLDESLAALTETERYILMNSLAYEQDGKYLPSAFIASTCAMFNISKVNFRKIKSLAFKKVESKIAQLQALQT